MEYWSNGVVESWSIGILEYWFEMVEPDDGWQESQRSR
jgi:hypothetical protein